MRNEKDQTPNRKMSRRNEQKVYRKGNENKNMKR